MAGNTERRKHIRNVVENHWHSIEIHDKHDFGLPKKPISLKVKTINVSDGGICILSNVSIELGQTIIFSDPDLPNKGTVAWTSQHKKEYKAGIQFIV